MELIKYILSGSTVSLIIGSIIIVVSGYLEKVSNRKRYATWICIGGIIVLISGIWSGFENYKDNEDKLRLTTELKKITTGEDSFCYLYFDTVSSNNHIDVYLITDGKYPLYDVLIRVYDITKQEELKFLTQENLAKIQKYYEKRVLYPGTSTKIDTWSKNKMDVHDINVFYRSGFGQWIQETRMRGINENHLKATRVKKGKTTLYKKISNGFPLNSENEVDW